MSAGDRTAEKLLGQGLFYCPKCKASVGYLRIGLLVPAPVDIWDWAVLKHKTETVSEYAECSNCRMRLESNVLRPETQKLLRLVADAASQLRSGVSYKAVRVWLVARCESGYIADRVLAVALGA